MKIHFATDHAGFKHKEAVVLWLKTEGFTVVDHGAGTLDENDDFPDYISLAASAVSKDPTASRGIIFGGSGQGEAMLANRYPKVRAAVFYGGDTSVISLSREHNDANVISIGARFVDIDNAKKAIWEWLHTDSLADEKYHRRNQKIEQITKNIQP